MKQEKFFDYYEVMQKTANYDHWYDYELLIIFKGSFFNNNIRNHNM